MVQTMTERVAFYRRKLLLLAAGWMAIAVPMYSQVLHADGPLPSFEVASIKPVDPNAPHTTGINLYPGGRLVIQSFSLKALILTAFDMSYWQISGGDGWMDTAQYNIEATPPEAWRANMPGSESSGYRIKDERERQMLQALLIDRFHLKFHDETKTGTVYLLEKSGKQLQLRPAKQAPPGVPGAQTPILSGNISRVSGRGWFLINTSMPQLAKYLSDYLLHRPVLDQTGLDGYFDFDSKVIQTDADFQNQNSDISSFLPVIGEMGLKLKRTTGPVETLVIDHAESPSEN